MTEEEVATLPDNLVDLADACAGFYEKHFAAPTKETVADYNEAANKYNNISNKDIMSLITLKTKQIEMATKKKTAVVKVKKAPAVKKPTVVKEVISEVSGAQQVRDAYDSDRESFSISDYSKASGISYQRVFGAIKTYKAKLGL